jgi:hypothetical protein
MPTAVAVAAGGLGELVVGRAEGVADFGGGAVAAAAGALGWPAQAVTSASTTAMISPAAIRLALLAAEVTAGV